jgi:hypothetical protein
MIIYKLRSISLLSSKITRAICTFDELSLWIEIQFLPPLPTDTVHELNQIAVQEYFLLFVTEVLYYLVNIVFEMLFFIVQILEKIQQVRFADWVDFWVVNHCHYFHKDFLRWLFHYLITYKTSELIFSN